MPYRKATIQLLLRLIIPEKSMYAATSFHLQNTVAKTTQVARTTLQI